MFGRVTITLVIGPHSSKIYTTINTTNVGNSSSVVGYAYCLALHGLVLHGTGSAWSGAACAAEMNWKL